MREFCNISGLVRPDSPNRSQAQRDLPAAGQISASPSALWQQAGSIYRANSLIFLRQGQLPERQGRKAKYVGMASSVQAKRGGFLNSLSGRFLMLTVGFVMLAEVLIFVPSIARFRADFLTMRRHSRDNIFALQR